MTCSNCGKQRRKRKVASPRTKMEQGKKLIESGTVIHVLLPHSVRYHLKFSSHGKTYQYVGEIPDSYEEKDEEFDRIAYNAIVYATHWV